MNNRNKEEKLIGSMMQKSFSEMPFLDFEEKVMSRIAEEKDGHKAVSGTIRFAWVFFTLGLFLGLVITSIASNPEYSIAGIPATKIALAMQVGIAIVLVLQFDRLLGITFKRRS